MGQHTVHGARPSPPPGRAVPVTGTRLLPAPGPAEHDLEPVTAPLLTQRHLPPRVPHPRRPVPTYFPASTARGQGPPLGTPSLPGSQVHGRRRATLAAVVVAVLLVAGAGGWWWVAHPSVAPTPVTASAPLPGAAGAPAAAAPTAAPDPGPMLLDEQGQPITSGPARAIRTFYRALAPYDPADLQRVTEPGQRSTVRTATAAPATRDTLRQVMRTTRITHQDEGLVYRGPGGLQIAFGPDTALLYDLILPGRDRATNAASARTAPTGPVPTLGAAGWRPGTTGYGQVRPSEANADGDGTSVVTNLHWKTWGGPTATAAGTASWVPPDGASADGVQTPAIVTASDLGPCQGHLGYRKITWYFPSHGETPTSSETTGYPDICTAF